MKGGEEEQEAQMAAALLASALESANEKPETHDNELPILEFRQVD